MHDLLKRKGSIEEYMNLPEGSSYQLINGGLIMAPSPITTHQRILLKLVEQLAPEIEKQHCGELFISPLDVHFDEANIFQPDIFFISSDNPTQAEDHDWIRAIPDMIIEILSPSTSDYDTGEKMKVYEKYGVREYFIVNPEDRMVHAYELMDSVYHQQYSETGRFKSILLQTEFQF